MKRAAFGALLVTFLAAPAAQADVVAALLKKYESQGARGFAASNGEAMWSRPFADAKSGDKRRCSSCHSDDLRRAGKHATTGKAIEPLAPSVNSKRLTDEAHVEKWFSRNCKWTLGRECTPQEKGDFLVMIRSK